MKGKNLTIRKQFFIGVLLVLLVIAVLSGAIQLYFMNEQIVNQTQQQAQVVGQDVLRDLEQTDVSTKAIEHQIDLKLVSYSKHIAALLQGKSADQIKEEDLIEIRDDLGLAGLTIFQEKEDDVKGIVATEESEVGFSFKEFGFYEVASNLVNGKEHSMPGATYTDRDTIILPIAQSGSHSDQPIFYKYAYYHSPGTDYLINPYIEANEVYDYTEEVGPAESISQIVNENDVIKEIGVLNPVVFIDPSLETQLYPPVKKVENGTFDLQTEKDLDLLTQSTIKKEAYLQDIDGEKIYKMFLPLEDGKVIYLALDYGKMSSPLYRHSAILIATGLISLVVLFLLTARFFNRIYENIQKIRNQIQLLEEGDLTAKSEINDGSELQKLSLSTNRMVDQLNKLVKGTQEQAGNTQRLSMLLEAEASQSVEKMYELSTEATIKSRERLYEVTDFISDVEQILQPYSEYNKEAKEAINEIGAVKEAVNDNTATTTNMTIQLSNLLQSLHHQSSELSDISNALLESMSKFKL